jgi:hypothetical protein
MSSRPLLTSPARGRTTLSSPTASPSASALTPSWRGSERGSSPRALSVVRPRTRSRMIYTGAEPGLRASGQLREAVAASDILHGGELTNAGDRKVLASIRAGALLDLFDVDGHAKWVSLAEKAASVTLAATPRDEEAWNIYRRLKAARERLGREPKPGGRCIQANRGMPRTDRTRRWCGDSDRPLPVTQSRRCATCNPFA